MKNNNQTQRELYESLREQLSKLGREPIKPKYNITPPLGDMIPSLYKKQEKWKA